MSICRVFYQIIHLCIDYSVINFHLLHGDKELIEISTGVSQNELLDQRGSFTKLANK